MDLSSEGSVKIKNEEEYDFAENLIKGIKKQSNEIPKIKGIYESPGINDDNNIINFPLFDFDKERKKNENETKSDAEINQLMQYYLFLAFYLQEAKKKESSLNYFLKNISMKNIQKEKVENEKNKDISEQLNINKLILRLYKLAHKFSDIEHRDYPYYSFYDFIINLDEEELKANSDVFDLFEENDRLGEIYRKVIIEKQQNAFNKLQKEETISYRQNSTNNIVRTSTNYKLDNNNDNTNNVNILRKSNIDILKNKIDIKSSLLKRLSVQSNKLNLELNESLSNSDEFNTNVAYIINSTSEFNSINDNNISPLIINKIGELLMKEFPKIGELNNMNTMDIIEETYKKLKDNKDLINLIGQLKYLKIDTINTKVKCLAFWLNCFNYLIIFVIFYRNWNIVGEKKWKKFLRNVKFEIGGKYFSFSDMEYIIFKKPSFFSSTYKAPDEIKKLNIEKINGDKKYDDYSKYIPFLLFLPIKKFLSPSLYDETNFDNQVEQRIKKYINKYIYIDEKKHLWCSELLLKYESNIFGKGLKKFESFFKPGIYSKIKEKKYKKIDSQKLTWNLNLDCLIDN